MLLDGVVQSRLLLNVECIDSCSVLQQILAQRNALNAVDEAGTAVKVSSKDVGSVCHQKHDNIKMSHETGAANWSRASV